MIDNIADYLFERRVRDCPPKFLAEELERLVWLMDDNGTEIFEAVENWLKSNDLKQIEIALEINEWFLFKAREEMIKTFDRIMLTYPQLKTKCEEHIKIWDENKNK